MTVPAGGLPVAADLPEPAFVVRVIARRPRPRAALVAAAVLGTAATTYLALAGTLLGQTRVAEDLWFFELSGLSPEGLGEPAAYTLAGVSVAALIGAWLLLGRAVGLGARAPVVFLVAALWALPLLAGPPLFSPDAYHYAAIGSAIQHDVDPFVDGPAAAGDVEGTRGAEPFWDRTPTPYSPPFVVLLAWISSLADEDLHTVLVVLRVLTVLGWVLLGGLVVRLARRCGVDPAHAAWLAVANPLLLVHAVSGLHNDALMTVLAVAGLAAALARRPYLGVALLVAAACVKVTALALIPVVVLSAAWRMPTRPAQLRVLAGTAALGAGGFALAVTVCGYGWRWVGNLSVPGKTVEPLSPPTALAFLVDPSDPPLDLVRGVALALGVAVSAFLLTRLPRWGVVRVAAWIWLAVLLSGASLWPWYLMPATVLLALTGRRGHTRLVVGWSVAGLFLALPGGRATLSLIERPWVDAGVLLVLAGVAAFAVRSRLRQTPEERHSLARSSAT